MRIIVMLKPTSKRGTKTAYTKFREHLRKDGYTLMQPEVFIRSVTSRHAAASHLETLRAQCPPTGTVRVITMTEKQFSRIHVLVGGPDAQEVSVGALSLIDL